MGTVVAVTPVDRAGDLMNRKQAIWQLQIVQAVVRRSREQGVDSPELRQRAAELVEWTAEQVDTDVAADQEWLALLRSVRALMEEG